MKQCEDCVVINTALYQAMVDRLEAGIEVNYFIISPLDWNDRFTQTC